MFWIGTPTFLVLILPNISNLSRALPIIEGPMAGRVGWRPSCTSASRGLLSRAFPPSPVKRRGVIPPVLRRLGEAYVHSGHPPHPARHASSPTNQKNRIF